VRADLIYASSPAGEGDGVVTYGEAFTVQPFGNSLVTMTLTGAQIEQVLEDQACGANEASPRILQPSYTLRYEWRASGPPCDKVDPASITIAAPESWTTRGTPAGSTPSFVSFAT